ncbi:MULTISPECIES: hypothetical protein [Bartonella]|uniref:hypothetical protein n=1 Tax=Bartonella TaxID=773 RepID=UPI0018DC071C|nr:MULTISPECIES: hypothetical protein [Bartonella]MBH9974354.1 hypothetical protein [Bartonella choladocola]MBI0013961.1 hypothetical protein [Bartonella sp. B10834G3]
MNAIAIPQLKGGDKVLKHSSDALQLSTYTRRSHFVYGVFEYLLVIVVTLAAIVTISVIFIDEFANLVETTVNSPIISPTFDNQ